VEKLLFQVKERSIQEVCPLCIIYKQPINFTLNGKCQSGSKILLTLHTNMSPCRRGMCQKLIIHNFILKIRIIWLF